MLKQPKWLKKARDYSRKEYGNAGLVDENRDRLIADFEEGFTPAESVDSLIKNIDIVIIDTGWAED